MSRIKGPDLSMGKVQRLLPVRNYKLWTMENIMTQMVISVNKSTKTFRIYVNV